MFRNKFLLVALVLVGVMLVFGMMGCAPEEPAPEPEEPEEPAEPEEPEEPVGTISHITGIDPGAGIMAATEDAMEVYDLQVGLLEGSDAAMTAELDSSIANEEWIIVTGWAPHWKFAEWDMKFLEDPELVYGGEEYIGNIARLGLSDDYPDVHEFLENFSWGPEDIGAVMAMNTEDDDFIGNAQTWVAENQDMVDGWIPEGLEGDGEEIEILMVEWECATASTYTTKAILQDAGYDVTVTPVDAGVMWASIAEGDADFFVCAWLPGTHEAYMDEYGDEIDEVGTQYEGARIGLVVPQYMPIDSITEINDYAD